MELVVTSVRPDNEKSDKAVSCKLYKAHKITKYGLIVEERFKKSIAAMSPKMGIASLTSNTPSEIVQTKFGGSPIGSTKSYQLSYMCVLRPTLLCMLM